jgi:hypothetical protein
MTEDVPVQGQGSSHFLKMTSDIFKAKGEDNGGIPSEGGIEPSNPIERAEIHTTTLWHFWRAPPRPLADPYRMGHGLPLEFLASSSPGTDETRPSRVVRCSHPSSLSKGCMRVVQMLPGKETMGSKPAINLEGSKAGPRLGFDSCPRVNRIRDN